VPRKESPPGPDDTFSCSKFCVAAVWKRTSDNKYFWSPTAACGLNPNHLLQVLYAARDVLVTAHAYRRLRLWHHACKTGRSSIDSACEVDLQLVCQYAPQGGTLAVPLCSPVVLNHALRQSLWIQLHRAQ